MEADNKVTTLKFENKSGVLLHPNYCLVGVDYEDKNANESEDTNNDKKNHTKMTLNVMKEWMHKNIVNHAEEYSGIHKNTNENE